MAKKTLLSMDPTLLRERYKQLQEDVPGSLIGAFFFGVQAVESVCGLKNKPETIEKLSALLIEIANGDQTLAPTGAELRRLAPDRDDLEEVRSENQKTQQVIARIMLERMNGTR